MALRPAFLCLSALRRSLLALSAATLLAPNAADAISVVVDPGPAGSSYNDSPTFIINEVVGLPVTGTLVLDITFSDDKFLTLQFDPPPFGLDLFNAELLLFHDLGVPPGLPTVVRGDLVDGNGATVAPFNSISTGSAVTNIAFRPTWQSTEVDGLTFHGLSVELVLPNQPTAEFTPAELRFNMLDDGAQILVGVPEPRGLFLVPLAIIGGVGAFSARRRQHALGRCRRS